MEKSQATETAEIRDAELQNKTFDPWNLRLKLPPFMRCNIKEKFWAWGDDFEILAKSGKPAYFVDGKAFSWGSKLSFQDMQGNELAFFCYRS